MFPTSLKNESWWIQLQQFEILPLSWQYWIFYFHNPQRYLQSNNHWDLLIYLHFTAWFMWRYSSHGRRVIGRTGRKLNLIQCRYIQQELLWLQLVVTYSEPCAMRCSKDLVTKVNHHINYIVDEVQQQAIKDDYSSLNVFS